MPWWKKLSTAIEAKHGLIFAYALIEAWPDKKTELQAWKFNRKKFAAEIKQSKIDCKDMTENRWLFDLDYVFNSHIETLQEEINKSKK